MFNIDELKVLEECIGLTINEYEGCSDLTIEYKLLEEIKIMIDKNNEEKLKRGKVNYFKCTFTDFNNGFVNGVYEGFDIENFGRELKELMEKHHIESICPTHLSNAQISRHVTDNEIHFVGMYFQKD